MALGGALASGNVLAACGGDDNGGSSTNKAATSAVPTGKALGDKLREILGEPKNLLSKGPGSFPVTGSWPLTGQGSIYGKLQTEGFRLGTEHIAAWTNNKLQFQVTALDHKSGDPAALVANVRKAGLANEPIFPTSYIFGFGAQTKGIAQYKMLSIDPGGGTGPLLKGLPYCYGLRTAYPTDLQGGLVKSVKALHPDVKKVAVVDVQVATPYNNAVKSNIQSVLKANGIEMLSYNLAPIGKTDYSSTISKVKGQNPDGILFFDFGTDIGYMARGVQRAGLQGVFGAVDFTPDGAKIAGPAYKDWIFSQDYINAHEPGNDWAKLFVSACQQKFRDVQNYHAAYYVCAFAYAIAMDRLLGQGGNVKSGADWVTAFESDLTFPHVYGSGQKTGQVVISKKTHSVESIPCLGLQAGGTGSTSDFKVVSTFDIDGGNFQKV